MKLQLQIDPSILPVIRDSDKERGGLPSASAAIRLANCEGSWKMERGQPQLKRLRADADRGHRIHAAWSGEAQRDTLKPDELEDLDSANVICGALVEKWEAERPELGNAELVAREERLWLRVGIIPVTSGRTDRVYRQGNRFLIPDLKTGWAEHPAPVHNLQLRVYALLVWADHPEAEEITVALVKPGFDGVPWSFTYRIAELEAAAYWWSQVLTGVFGPNPTLNAGEHCEFCKAQTTCVARLNQVATFRAALTPEAKTWATLAPAERSALFKAWKQLEKFGEEIEGRIRAELEAGVQLPGLSLGTGRARREIEDVNAAVGKIGDRLTRGELLACVKLSFAKVRDAIGKKRGTPVKERDAAAKTILGNAVIESTDRAPIEIA